MCPKRIKAYEKYLNNRRILINFLDFIGWFSIAIFILLIIIFN